MISKIMTRPVEYKNNKNIVLKPATKKDCLGGCPYCGFQINNYDFIQKCFGCKRLRDISVERIEAKVKKRIHGRISSYDFVINNEKVILFTTSFKYENLYLYDIELDKIIWSKRIPKEISKGNIYLKRVLCIKDRAITVVSPSWATEYVGCLESYDLSKGNLISQYKTTGEWSNTIKWRQGIVVGCRRGFLYYFDKDLNIINNFSLKEPGRKYENISKIPFPFNITTDDREEYLSFSSMATLFLFDSNFNFIWNENLSRGYIEHIISAPFMGNLEFQQKKYTWALKALGVESNSTIQDIKKAFRKKALEWHPDRHEEKNKKKAEEKFKESQNAYELLSDISKDELKKELKDLDVYPSRSVKFLVADFFMINKIEFWRKRITEELYIKVNAVQKEEFFLDIKGEALEGNVQLIPL